MNNKKPKVIISIALHGDEKIGFRVKKSLEKIPGVKDRVMFLVSNEMAAKKHKRFIDSDMNRVFPGLKNGNYEQRRASEIIPIIKSADLVLDIHSTTSDLKDAVIVTKLNNKIKHFLSVINPKYVLYMKHDNKSSMIYHAKAGIAFEYGKDNDKKTIENVTRDIERVLVDLKIVLGRLTKKACKTKCFEVRRTFPKYEGHKLIPKIRNYKLVKKGDVVCFNEKHKILAQEDFYPILFGERNYKDIFGYVGKDVNFLL